MPSELRVSSAECYLISAEQAHEEYPSECHYGSLIYLVLTLCLLKSWALPFSLLIHSDNKIPDTGNCLKENTKHPSLPWSLHSPNNKNCSESFHFNFPAIPLPGPPIVTRVRGFSYHNQPFEDPYPFTNRKSCKIESRTKETKRIYEMIIRTVAGHIAVPSVLCTYLFLDF